MIKLFSVLLAATLMFGSVAPFAGQSEQILPDKLAATEIRWDEFKMIEVPESERGGMTPEDAANLNEALNVPGGNIEFVSESIPEYDTYVWEVEGDYAKSTIAGIHGNPNIWGMAQSTVYTNVSGYDGMTVSFDFKVSCESAYNTDWLGFFIDNHMQEMWCGEVDWNTVTFNVPAGNHELAWVYSKDMQNSEGEDTAYLDNVRLEVPETYELVHSPELDAVLNDDGGTLEFMTVAEPTNGYYPWIEQGDYAVSTNQGIDNMGSSSPSISMVNTTVTAQEGDVVSFNYKVSSESRFDFLCFFVDDEHIDRWSGEIDWTNYNYELTPGEHELAWTYTKDVSGAEGDDTGYLDSVSVGAPQAVTGVEIQPSASVPGYRRAQLEWQVFPINAFNQAVTFSSSDENTVTCDANGVITGVAEGEAVITVTTVDGGFTADCLVTVTEAVPPVDIYGFMFARMEDNTVGYFTNEYKWCTFTDTNPGDVSYIECPPDGEERLITCAEYVDGTVYGYTRMGRYFHMDFDSLVSGNIEIEYMDCNVSYSEEFYPHEMAYDHSTGTMYVLTSSGELHIADRETGNVDLSRSKYITGDVPGMDPDPALYNLGLAIDLEGNAYLMLSGYGFQDGGNGGSRLCSLNLETAEYTVIGQTTAKCYQEQSMCFDHNTGMLYWAQFAAVYNLEPMSLYIVDPATAEVENMGHITEYGAQILGMFIPYDGEPTPSEYDLGDVNMDGFVNTGDASALLRHTVDLIALTDEQLELGDFNGDGNTDTGDAAAILHYAINQPA